MNRVAVHASHEAAEKLGGIGTVLDGVLPQSAYLRQFPWTLLAGAYHFPNQKDMATHLSEDRWRLRFDSLDVRGDLRQSTSRELSEVAHRSGCRIVLGERRIGQDDMWASVLLVGPEGVRRDLVDSFLKNVRERFGIDLERFETYCAIEPTPKPFLHRLLTGKYDQIEPDKELTDWRQQPVYGGVPFANGHARFPAIQALDSFVNFYKCNPYLVEMQFHTFVAPVLWQAARVILKTEWDISPHRVFLFSHDWIGVPLYWALRLDNEFQKAHSVYIAHETRIARILAEGVLTDTNRIEVQRLCRPEGHDATFYHYMKSQTEKGVEFEDALPGTEGFRSIFYHEFNRQARHFDQVIAVGDNVAEETKWILRQRWSRQPLVTICPNGVPDFDATPRRIDEARRRLGAIAETNFQFTPDWIFTAVSRLELSKGPWRNLGFLESVAKQDLLPGKLFFIWVSRTKNQASDGQIAEWAKWGWPLVHSHQSTGGDLTDEEIPIWTAIEKLNAEHGDRIQILYANQFGWNQERLGALNANGSTFKDIRLGIDVELGLSVYEPFGIAPLEPLGSGAVSVVSDSSGAAHHLAKLAKQGKVSEQSFVIARFSEHKHRPHTVTPERLRSIEETVYRQIAADIAERLAVPREERLAAARMSMKHLSWQCAVEEYLLPALSDGTRIAHERGYMPIDPANALLKRLRFSWPWNWR